MRIKKLHESLKDSNKSILFIIGAARSGTTYLESIIDDWFGYGMGPEGTFVEDFARRLHKYGNLLEMRNLRRLVHDLSHCEMLEIVRNRWSEDTRFDTTTAFGLTILL